MYYPLTIYGNSAPFFMNECGHFFCKRCTMHATACYVCHKAMYLAMAIKDGVTYTLDGARLKRYSQMHNSRELNNAQLTKLRQFEKVTCFGARQAANPVSVPSVASTSQCSCATNCYGYYCELTTQPSREVTVDPTLTDAIQRNNKLMTSPKLSTLPTYYRQDLENFLCIRPQYTNRQLYQFLFEKGIIQEDEKQQLRNILMVFERSDLTTNKAEEHDTTVDREMINEVDDDDDYVINEVDDDDDDYDIIDDEVDDEDEDEDEDDDDIIDDEDDDDIIDDEDEP
nr:hypothetical protein ICELHAMJ_00002 [Cydia pomonella granulovirus]WOZ47077.1 hypothetical protein NJLGDECI_00003 [Cydia pomonella granulovirus]